MGKRSFICILFVLIVLSPVLAVDDVALEELKKNSNMAYWDINAYIRNPLDPDGINQDVFEIKLFDAVNSLTEISTVNEQNMEKPGANDKFLILNKHISTMEIGDGLPLATLVWRGLVAPKSNGLKSIYTITVSPQKGTSFSLKNVATYDFANSTGHEIPLSVGLRQDRVKFSAQTSNIITDAGGRTSTIETDVDPASHMNKADPKKITLTLTNDTATAHEWVFEGTVFLKMDKTLYENAPSGTYREVIVFHIGTDAV